MERSAPGHIHIQGKKMQVQFLDISIKDLRYLPSNPRVKSLLPANWRELPFGEQQDLIQKLMKKENSVINLMDRIVEAGGLNEPVFVRMDKQIVIEGNSRLCVYRQLYEDAMQSAQADPSKWEKIPCKVVESLTDEEQWAFLHETHVEGKTQWAAYEKANVAYTMVKEEKRSIEETAKVLNIKQITEIRKRVEVIELMLKNGETKRDRFSYYDQLVRNVVINKEFTDNPEFRSTILNLINPEDEEPNAFTAMQMRDKLKPIIQKPKELKRFLRTKDLDDSYNRAKVDSEVTRLKNIRNTLRDVEKDDFINIEDDDLRAALFEINKMPREVARISEFLEQILKSKGINV